jgi:hypothetical protein
MFNRSHLLPLVAFAAIVGCSGAPSSSTNVGATSEALRGTITRVDTSAHRLSLHTSRGEVEASWQEPEVRHGALSNLIVSKEIELRGHSGEKEFEVESIELEPELGDDHGNGTEPGDDKGMDADGGRGADDDASTAPPGTPPVDDHGGKGKP